MTSNAKVHWRFGKADFIYIAKDDEYLCPAGERAIYRSAGGRTTWTFASTGPVPAQVAR